MKSTYFNAEIGFIEYSKRRNQNNHENHWGCGRIMNGIALFALLTASMSKMNVVIDALKAAGKRNRVKVVVGGAPVTAAFAERIGADGHAPDASRVVGMIKALME